MDYITIKGYKSIKDQTLILKPINLLIGSNGSGKSNFLSFFQFLKEIYRRNLGEYTALTGSDRILHKGFETTDTISFRMEFNNGKNGYSVIMKMGDNRFVITDERLIFKGDDGTYIDKNDYEARITITDNFRAKYVKEYLNGLMKYHFHDTSGNSPFNTTSNVENDIYILYENGSNLAAFLWNIQEEHPKHYRRIVETVKSIAPFFHDFYLNPNKNGIIRLQWQDKYSSTVYGVNDLSDGTLRFIALATLFLQPSLPDTIIIDEPELGLHPFAIAKLSGLIQSAAANNCQIIAATQSADLLGFFTPEDIVTVDQIEGETQFNRLDPEKYKEWLDVYTLDELWRRNIIANGQPNY